MREISLIDVGKMSVEELYRRYEHGHVLEGVGRRIACFGYNAFKKPKSTAKVVR